MLEHYYRIVGALRKFRAHRDLRGTEAGALLDETLAELEHQEGSGAVGFLYPTYGAFLDDMRLSAELWIDPDEEMQS